MEPFHLRYHALLLLLLLLLTCPPPGSPLRPPRPSHCRPPRALPPPAQGAAAAPPLLPDQPFVVLWNMPTAGCQKRYGVRLDLADFGIVANQRERFKGQKVSIFYSNQLGNYPYLSPDGEKVNGGLPQSADLPAHLALAEAQISGLLRPNFAGVAVVDWEKWRALWERNFDSKEAYRRRSEELVRRRRPGLSGEEVRAEARRAFEAGARRMMGETLRLGVRLRPHGLWGFYRYPACYNEPGRVPGVTYTGQCHRGTRRLNDRLSWLWQLSTALYPSIYLPRWLEGSNDSALMVRYRVLEALRVASVWRHGNNSNQAATPVIPYATVAFTHTLDFLNETDLDHTLGESAALGAAGVVLWGEQAFASSKERCAALRDFTQSTLGPYVRELRSRTQRCSRRRCHGNGRCARKAPGSGHMIPRGSGKRGSPFGRFLCHCYHGWTGERCEERLQR